MHMAQMDSGDFPLDASAIDGTELCERLNKLQQAFITTNLGTGRPPYLTAGTFWVYENTAGDTRTLMYFDGNYDRDLITTAISNGNVIRVGYANVIQSTASRLVTATNVQDAINLLSSATYIASTAANAITATNVDAAITQLSLAANIRSSAVNLVTNTTVNGAINQLSQAAYITNSAANLITATNVNAAIAQLSNASNIYTSAFADLGASNVQNVLALSYKRMAAGQVFRTASGDALPNSGTWYQIAFNGLNFDTGWNIAVSGAAYVTAIVGGVYRIYWGVQCLAGVNLYFETALYVNGTLAHYGQPAYCYDNSTGVITSTGSIEYWATAGDVFTVYVKRNAIGSSITGGGAPGRRVTFLGADLIYRG